MRGVGGYVRRRRTWEEKEESERTGRELVNRVSHRRPVRQAVVSALIVRIGEKAGGVDICEEMKVSAGAGERKGGGRRRAVTGEGLRGRLRAGSAVEVEDDVDAYE
jgi:hypothetical protein